MAGRMESTEMRQQQMMAFLARAVNNPAFLQQLLSARQTQRSLDNRGALSGPTTLELCASHHRCHISDASMGLRAVVSTVHDIPSHRPVMTASYPRARVALRATPA